MGMMEMTERIDISFRSPIRIESRSSAEALTLLFNMNEEDERDAKAKTVT